MNKNIEENSLQAHREELLKIVFSEEVFKKIPIDSEKNDRVIEVEKGNEFPDV